MPFLLIGTAFCRSSCLLLRKVHIPRMNQFSELKTGSQSLLAARSSPGSTCRTTIINSFILDSGERNALLKGGEKLGGE